MGFQQNGSTFSTRVVAVYLRCDDYVDLDLHIAPESIGWHGAVLALTDTSSGEQVYSLRCDVRAVAVNDRAAKPNVLEPSLLKPAKRRAVVSA